MRCDAVSREERVQGGAPDHAATTDAKGRQIVGLDQAIEAGPGKTRIGHRVGNGEGDRGNSFNSQMFLGSGDGVVFKGAVGPWYSLTTSEFHLDEAKAKEIARLVSGVFKTRLAFSLKERRL